MTPPVPPPAVPDPEQMAALARHMERVARRLEALAAARDESDRVAAALRAELDGLAARAEQADERAARAEATVAAHEGHIVSLANSVQRLAGLAAGGADRPLSWLVQGPPASPPDGDQAGRPGGPPDPAARITEQDATAHLDELAGWLAEVYLRFPGADLPSCWAWHPAVVEELWWLRGAHIDAYTGKAGSWAKVGDWHDRFRPGVVRRVTGWIGTCELARHDHGRGDRADQGVPAVPLAVHLPDVAGAWSQERRTPALTGQMLFDAERHDRVAAR